TGWSGLPQYWKWSNDELVATADSSLDDNTVLTHDRHFRDFEIEWEMKLEGEQANSGLQIRSQLTDPATFVAEGPQVDAGSDFWGSLYGEKTGEGMMSAADPAVIAQVVRQDDFNKFHVRCVGKHVTITLNGTVTTAGEFPTMADEGIIAWQLHGKRPMTARFRNMRIRDLSSTGNAGAGVQSTKSTVTTNEQVASTSKTVPKSPPGSVHSPRAQVSQETFHSFTVRNLTTLAAVSLSANREAKEFLSYTHSSGRYSFGGGPRRILSFRCRPDSGYRGAGAWFAVNDDWGSFLHILMQSNRRLGVYLESRQTSRIAEIPLSEKDLDVQDFELSFVPENNKLRLFVNRKEIRSLLLSGLIAKTATDGCQPVIVGPKGCKAEFTDAFAGTINGSAD
ncbi:MAG: DUF1080 domain-containing protein, partial [Planctomycetaceae bacterium]|nr:DUF1080 domain-containing protein [Planctomycetaceae bacterium]